MSLTAAIIGYLFQPENFSFLVLFFVVLTFFRWAQVYFTSIRYLPPGPRGLPFLGYLPYLKDVPHEQFCELAKKHGPIFSTRLGSHLLVVLSDYKTIRDAFRLESFSGRPVNETSNIIEGFGVINVDGELWKQQRSFLHRQLRCLGMKNFGSGKEKLEGRIMLEVDNFLTLVGSTEGKPMKINSALNLCVSNVICSMLMSVRFGNNDARFERFMYLIEEGFKLVSSVAATNFLPCLKNLPRHAVLTKKIQANRMEMAEFFREIVDMHKATFDPDKPRDLVDMYLAEIEKAKEQGYYDELFERKNPDRQVYQIMGDLFSAGMETIKITLLWSVVIMMKYPDIMKKVQRDLDQMIGRSRLPRLDDMESLPYVEAVILEVLRFTSVVPMGTTHATLDDVWLDGYLVPKNTQVIPLLHAVHHDPQLWEEPEKFIPERFLNENGRVTKPEFFMPFGVGRRMCLGDVMARMELFLFFSSLLHMFDLRLPEGKTLPSFQSNAGAVTVSPKIFEVCCIQRETDQELFYKQDKTDCSLHNEKRNIGVH